MSRKILNAKGASYLLLLLMGCLAGTIGWQVEARAQVETIGSVMYLVPSNPQAIEEKFNPEQLLELDILDLGVTTNWNTISDLAHIGQLKALIVHHAVLDKVDDEELSSWFRNDKVVVTGLGIQGDQLAELIGMPRLYSYPNRYTHTEFFYTYHYAMKRTSADLYLFKEDHGSADFKAKRVLPQLSYSSGYATDSLLNDLDAKRMLIVTKEKIEHQ